ncbi:peptide chain release factor N(5)-glutamine methyltransferase [Uliginosibacterium sp. H3]|uniref:Release factor glutamine methyltransferase n=1 Tax=Uliginosibacterium silvisoli TaxID=3114758 RepID=A0ABU6JXW1_9RHOO|nr:peptide chain release factor N(5)-glutamine methyltransferase [Uliginosibacterium sp. H3]
MSLPATLGEALQLARGRIESVDAKLLLREASGCSAATLIGFPERALDVVAAQRFVDWLERREQGEPVAHLLGQREFFGRMFRVTADTLIPRPDTELLVELVLGLVALEPLSRPCFTAGEATRSSPPSSGEGLGERVQQAAGANDQHVSRVAVPSSLGAERGFRAACRTLAEPVGNAVPAVGRGAGWPEAGRGEREAPAPTILDLGTGTGAIAISIALERPHAKVTAVDASVAALAVAQDNAQKLDAPVRFLHGSWFAPVAGERFELIVSNPPYIAANDEHLAQGDVRFEPLSALVAGTDGLDDIRDIIAAAPAHLVSGGWLLLEHGYDQAAAVRALLATSGFVEVQSWKDLAGIERASGGRVAY